MFRSFRFGSVLGIPLKLDITFLLILPIFAWLIGVQIGYLIELTNTILGTGLDPEPLSAGLWPWILGFIAAVGLFVGVLLHELGHSLVAIRYGYDIDSITLWLFGGLAQLTDQPDDWSHELAIAIAGPAVSVAVGVISFLLLFPAGPLGPSIVFILGYLAMMNIALAIFNMLPAFPMDGGRVLRALLARSRPFTEATQLAAETGKLFAILMGLFGIFQFNIILVGIAFFIYIAASGEAQQTVVRAAFEDVTVGELMATEFKAVAADLSIDALIDRMFEDRTSGYPVLEGDSLVGVVTLDDARSVDEIEREALTVADVMTTDVKTISPQTEALTALQIMQQNNIGRLLVADPDDRLLGTLSRHDMMAAFDVLREANEGSEPATELEPTNRALTIESNQESDSESESRTPPRPDAGDRSEPQP